MIRLTLLLAFLMYIFLRCMRGHNVHRNTRCTYESMYKILPSLAQPRARAFSIPLIPDSRHYAEASLDLVDQYTLIVPKVCLPNIRR